MRFLKLINKRYSVRAYKSQTVEDEKLQIVLEAARLAPTANNQQPFQIIIVHTKGRHAELLSIFNRDWFVQAPVLLFVCARTSSAWVRRDGRRYIDVDLGIVMDHIVLAAAEIGLGTCIIAAFDVQAARNVLNVPEDVEPFLITPLGYPADRKVKKVRKSIDEIIRYEQW